MVERNFNVTERLHGEHPEMFARRTRPSPNVSGWDRYEEWYAVNNKLANERSRQPKVG